MWRWTRTALIATVIAASACGRSSDHSASDPTLDRDLSTASQLPPRGYLDSIAAIEQTGAAAAPVAAEPVGSAPAPRRATRRTVSTGEVERTTNSSGASVPAREPRVITEKHTARDAAIGAAAGAIIGGVASRDKVKGAVIGGTAGAILGGVIGNNIDKKKRTVP